MRRYQLESSEDLQQHSKGGSPSVRQYGAPWKAERTVSFVSPGFCGKRDGTANFSEAVCYEASSAFSFFFLKKESIKEADELKGTNTLAVRDEDVQKAAENKGIALPAKTEG
ncbi:uncharacterized protein TEOVI_000281700 [Trypanosoma equiperdum]|uniref:Uncharacterized protein n=1 Tax=Trypanosoma equiperdum TaxID=5694 RepID=A0A1G4IGE1_TRYEQ|nr:hypothetical protein TEOVI_000281700 [Trypanosoma equiperdum]